MVGLPALLPPGGYTMFKYHLKLPLIAARELEELYSVDAKGVVVRWHTSLP